MAKYDITRETYSEPSRSQWLETIEAADGEDAILRAASHGWDVDDVHYLRAEEVIDDACA